MTLLTISHLINVLLAGGIGTLLWIESNPVTRLFGPACPARAMLTSVYFAIAITSMVALWYDEYMVLISTVLLPLQLIYQLTTPFTVGSLRHPIVLGHIFVGALHLVTLYSIFQMNIL